MFDQCITIISLLLLEQFKLHYLRALFKCILIIKGFGFQRNLGLDLNGANRGTRYTVVLSDSYQYSKFQIMGPAMNFE